MNIVRATALGLMIAVLFACNDEDAFTASSASAGVGDTGSGSGSGTGSGTGTGPGSVSTQVAHLRMITDVVNVDGFVQPRIREVMMSDDGSVMMVVTTEDLDGNNPDGLHQIYRINEGSGAATMMTNFTNANNTGATEIVVSLARRPVNLLPVLSGDGSTIAFIHTYNPLGTNADGSPELFVIDVATGTLAQRTDNLFTTISVLKPSITDDGSLLAFVSRDNYTSGNSSGVDQIFTITTDGSNTITQITNNQIGAFSAGYFTGSEDIESYGYHNSNQGLFISGSGNRIAFLGNGDWHNDGSLPINATEVFFINIDGSNLTRVSAAGGKHIVNPRISDDGIIIVYGQTEGISTASDPANLYSYNVNSSIRTNLTNNTADQRFYEFALTGDGNNVIYRFQNDIKNTNTGTLDLVKLSTDGLNTSTTIFSIPSQPIDDINSFSWSQIVIPDFIFFPKTTTDGSKTIFGTTDYRLPPAIVDDGESQLYIATNP